MEGIKEVQCKKAIMVWAGIYNDQVIWPYFFDGNVNGETYLAMLLDF